jgi:hypothetical protein
MPIIAYGIIEHYRITEGQNRVYYVNIHNFLDSPKLINRFITNKAFNIVPFDKDYLQTKKKMQITLNSDFSKYLFPVEAFFCRPSLNQIVTLRNEYFQIIKKDTLQILSDIDDLIYTDIE